MNKEFVPYYQALALKELGFDEPCFGFYGGLSPLGDRYSWNTGGYNNNSDIGDSKNFHCTRPLYQQAFRWFREKYNRLHTVNIDLSNNLKDKVFVYTIENHLGSIVDRSEEFNTYEEAELACLIKLIEIVKEK